MIYDAIDVACVATLLSLLSVSRDCGAWIFGALGEAFLRLFKGFLAANTSEVTPRSCSPGHK
jgi:hypothetical protein